jgi:hypothetical protein
MPSKTENHCGCRKEEAEKHSSRLCDTKGKSHTHGTDLGACGERGGIVIESTQYVYFPKKCQQRNTKDQADTNDIDAPVPHEYVLVRGWWLHEILDRTNAQFFHDTKHWL